MKGLRQLDGSVIWADGSRTYPPATNKAKEPPGTYPYPPPMGGVPVEIADENPSQGAPYPQANPGPFPPVISKAPPVATVSTPPDITPLPQSPSAADLWDRWQKLVANWACLITWGGGDLDKLTAKLSNMPMIVTNKGSKTAVGWWRDIMTAGYDKATALADLSKGLGVDANDMSALIGQFNNLALLARAQGYTGCAAPPAQNPNEPPVPSTPIAQAHSAMHAWWAGLSTGGKVIAGGAGLLGLGLIIRGAAK